jgi:hypothetical protein
MSDSLKEFVLYACGGVALLLVGWGLLEVLLALAAVIPVVVTGIFFLILQIVVLLLSVVLLGVLGFLLLNFILNILAKFEESFSSQIEGLRRQINKLTNNLASEVLAIVTAILISIAQDHLSSDQTAKYSIGILSGVYLFFAIQLIKSKGRKDRYIGVFFYLFPILIAGAYYASDIQILVQQFSQASAQDLVLPASAAITLILAFYYAFKPQIIQGDG